jgi:hypothetical protein
MEVNDLLSRNLSVEVLWHLRAVQETLRKVDPPVRSCDKIENMRHSEHKYSETFTRVFFQTVPKNCEISAIGSGLLTIPLGELIADVWAGGGNRGRFGLLGRRLLVEAEEGDDLLRARGWRRPWKGGAGDVQLGAEHLGRGERRHCHSLRGSVVQQEWEADGRLWRERKS